MPFSQGFEISSGLMRIASFIVSNDAVISSFAFTDGGMLLHMSHTHLKDEDMLEEARGIIKSFIDREQVGHLEEYTFEFHLSNYFQVKDPKWWIKSLKDIYK